MLTDLPADPDALPGEAVAGLAGGRAVATNVFRRTPDGWRLWLHHASPVLTRERAGRGRVVTGDRIAVRGIAAHGHHGVYAEERATGQPFVVDVVLHLDLAPAAASDDVADTVHYGELAQQVVAAVEGEPVDLVETLAQRVADLALAYPRVDAGRGDRAQAGGAGRRAVRGRRRDDRAGPVMTEDRAPGRARARQQPGRPAGAAPGRGRRAGRHPRARRCWPSRRSTRPTRSAARTSPTTSTPSSSPRAALAARRCSSGRWRSRTPSTGSATCGGDRAPSTST